MRGSALAGFTTLLAACANPPRQAATADTTAHDTAGTRWLVGPTPTADLLRATTSEADLHLRFGSASTRPDSIHVGEGQFEPGTVLFPDEPRRRLEITWEDSLARARPALIRLRGDTTDWMVHPGVTLGTALSVVDSLNGGPFTLTGFGWDYAGTVLSYDGGRLDALWRGPRAPGELVRLRFRPEVRAAPDSLEAAVAGDRPFSSAHPAMRRLNPRVYEILIGPR